METIEEKREKQIRIIKASNEMLEEAKKIALEKTDFKKREEIEWEFDKAIKDNLWMAENYLFADKETVDNATYREVDKVYVEKYERGLKAKDLTDEQLRQKEVSEDIVEWAYS
jgi:uncharacterized surface anchored protein